jgi:hypothetical protein
VIEKTIKATLGLPLVWWRTRLMPAAYELRAGPDCVARLEYGGFFQRTVRAETRDGAWWFRKPGPFSRTILIDDANSGARSEYRGGPMQGLVRLDGGREFRVSRVGFIPRSISVSSASGSGLLRVDFNWFAARKVARTIVENAGTAEPALDLLAMLAFHVLILRRRRARG